MPKIKEDAHYNTSSYFHYFNIASANASKAGISACFMVERIVTIGSTISIDFILSNASRYVKDNGTIVYSTCTVNKRENEDVINKILTEFPDVSLVPLSLLNTDTVPTLPSTVKGTMLVAPSQLYEGFFVAKIRKKAAKRK